MSKKTDYQRLIKILDRAKLAIFEYPKTMFAGNARRTLLRTHDVNFWFDEDGRLVSAMPSQEWLDRQLRNPGFVAYVLDFSPLLPAGQLPTTGRAHVSNGDGTTL